jgi:hypothetical protein
VEDCLSQQLPLALEDVAPTPRRRQRRAFHVRSHQTVEEALAGEQRAGRQDRRVLEVFRDCGRRLTPSQVHGLLCDECGPPAPLLTSIRRSLTNLTSCGLLIHYPADRRLGPHGVKESTWGLP